MLRFPRTQQFVLENISQNLLGKYDKDTIKCAKNNLKCKGSIKNPAYGRHRISRSMRIVAPIPQ